MIIDEEPCFNALDRSEGIVSAMIPGITISDRDEHDSGVKFEEKIGVKDPGRECDVSPA